MSRVQVAIICDLVEENWPSMNLVAEMLLEGLAASHSAEVQAVQILPNINWRFTRLPLIGTGQTAYNADRLINRFWDYPQLLKAQNGRFDLYHVIDHSYAQLVHTLPPERSIVTCHDLDTFRCLLDPEREPRPPLFKLMVKRILEGLRRAAKVVCDSVATRDQLLGFGLIPPERLAIVPLSVHPSCSSEASPASDGEAIKLLGPVRRDAVELLHVGSTIPRKRIDVLLRIFAEVRRKFPQTVLVRVGGSFTEAQTKLAQGLGLIEAVRVMPFLDREVLAALYRRAALVLQPSEAEGFGLPVAEAMACGTPVVASDLAVLREVGGAAATYCPVGDIQLWSKAISDLLEERIERPELWAARCTAALAQATKFSWAAYTRQMIAIYREVLA